jgi:hypothetical protein
MYIHYKKEKQEKETRTKLSLTQFKLSFFPKQLGHPLYQASPQKIKTTKTFLSFYSLFSILRKECDDSFFLSFFFFPLGNQMVFFD